MIYKVFYQETKDQSPRREQTKALYLEIDAASELEGRIQARQLVEKHTNYNIEFIELLSDNHLEYEKTHADFTLTEF
ncbi:DNA-dependent RNA polymerase subunit epsilon [Streptococcus minor]|uniref:DNA-dependent RNA polymerase subunit epsilon n=1 Tax=Streptococcus minor TaxID=229549 RepID=UPI0003724779|nr:DNA-dependent RNA polymerase subunit epsilon [Streptococcus minor]